LVEYVQNLRKLDPREARESSAGGIEKGLEQTSSPSSLRSLELIQISFVFDV